METVGEMDMFGKKKNNALKKEVIPDDIQICTLYSLEKNEFGTELLTSIVLCKEIDGYSFNHKNQSFAIKSVEWGGKRTRSYSSTNIDSLSTSDTKRKGRIIGAAVGTMVAPGVGTVIGAAYGTGNKKSVTNTVNNVNTKENIHEVFSDIVLNLEYIDGTRKKVLLKCLEKAALIIINLVEQKNHNSSDPIKIIKELKELFDVGAITEEEFENKKKVILKSI